MSQLKKIPGIPSIVLGKILTGEKSISNRKLLQKNSHKHSIRIAGKMSTTGVNLKC
jgi:hypothetical protein